MAASRKKSEREKMVTGEIYDPNDPDLVADRTICRESLRLINYDLKYSDRSSRIEILQKLLGFMDSEHPPWLEPPFYCDYG